MSLFTQIPLSTRVKLLDRAIAIPALRRRAWKILDRATERSLVERDHMSYPRQVQLDKLSMARALMKAVDRGLSNGTIGSDVRRKLSELLLGKILYKSPHRQDFRRQHGITPPSFITISPTARCNLRCIGCYAGSDELQRATLPFDVFDRILTEKAKLWNAHFTVISGGEPFLYRDAGHDLLDMIERHPEQFFLIYSNGTLITPQVARRMRKLGNVTPAISVEGFEDATDARRGTGVFRKILTAFQNLRAEGVPFGISATVFRHNADILFDDEHVDFFFEQQGALYAWIFQYMPIGRGADFSITLTPEQRLRLFHRTWDLIRNRGLFLADFWNCGTAANGCIAAGGGLGGGYLYINWHGAVAPCAFAPFSVHNIKDVYAQGGDLNTVLFSPFFKDIRNWQTDFFYDQTRCRKGNLLAPCPFRDHHDIFHEIIRRRGAMPIDNDGQAVLDDGEYTRTMIDCGQCYQELTKGVWSEEYLQSGLESGSDRNANAELRSKPEKAPLHMEA